MQIRSINSILLGVTLFGFGLFSKASETGDSSSKKVCTMRVIPIRENTSQSVQIVLTKYVDGKARPVEDLVTPVKIYLNETKEFNPASCTGLLGTVYVNWEGEGILRLPESKMKTWVNLHEKTFIAILSSDPVYADLEKEVTVIDARVTLEYSGADSIKTAKATLEKWNDTGYVPVPEADLKLGIKRTLNYFSFIPEGATSDEQGMVSGELPLDLPGNEDGTITLLARIEEHEDFGTIEVSKTVPWNVLPLKNPERGRTLWSPGDNAPIILVVTSVITIVVIWATIFYLIYLLYRLKKLGSTT